MCGHTNDHDHQDDQRKFGTCKSSSSTASHNKDLCSAEASVRNSIRMTTNEIDDAINKHSSVPVSCSVVGLGGSDGDDDDDDDVGRISPKSCMQTRRRRGGDEEVVVGLAEGQKHAHDEEEQGGGEL